MAARTTSQRAASADLEEADVDASTAADPFDDEPDDVLEADDGPSADLDDDEETDTEDDLVDGDLAADEELPDAEDDDADEETVATALVTPDAAFDDDDDGLVAVVAGDDDEDDDEEIEGLRDGEFVCRSCHLAMRDTQLADPKNMICRDCA
ncbi:MAG: hypothetical protein EA388_07405 [Nitriliruptor sp.]|nr:MAG: hypothetical protein EA388_07405 [Nitriliruptor sp.]